MKIYEGRDIRNVGVVGHGDSGKTSLTAGLLYAAGATNRLTRVDEGNTITDFDEEEIQRKISISHRPGLCRVEEVQDQHPGYAGRQHFHQRYACGAQ